MFVLQKERLVKAWPAVVMLPVDGGKVIEEKITLDMAILDGDGSYKLLSGHEETFKNVIKGWSGIGGSDGSPLPFNSENLSLLIKDQYFVAAAIRAYQQAAGGQAAEKN
ncbi:TPA: hypothetical protein ACMDOB_000554 [Vibrio metschnikovii]|nr:hypothetical protein [Vibrio metschnikovii]